MRKNIFGDKKEKEPAEQSKIISHFGLHKKIIHVRTNLIVWLTCEITKLTIYLDLDNFLDVQALSSIYL